MHDFKRADLTAIKNDLININWVDPLYSVNDIESIWSTFNTLLKNRKIIVHCPLKKPNNFRLQCLLPSLEQLIHVKQRALRYLK